jgi:hypothetical protein
MIDLEWRQIDWALVLYFTLLLFGVWPDHSSRSVDGSSAWESKDHGG